MAVGLVNLADSAGAEHAGAFISAVFVLEVLHKQAEVLAQLGSVFVV